MKYDVWYMKPSWFGEGIFGKKPDPAKLEATHTPLKSVEVEDGTPNLLEYVFRQMQAEVWSPNGEARSLIRQKGLEHTSMSVGDVVVSPGGNKFVVGRFGFEELV
jgi:hypothetical protein